MAKYAQGYARKNSDSKNLIILISTIVLVVAIAIVFAILYNKFWKKDTKTFESTEYSAYFLTDYDKLLDQKEKNYIIYICSSSSTSDTNMEVILGYLDDYMDETKDINVKLYLVDYDKFDSSSDSTESENATKVTAELGFTVSQSGYLIAVQNNEIINQSTQVLKETANIKKAIETLDKNEVWLNFNK